MRMTHRRHPRSRSRRLVRPGHWHVHARVERFVEPSLLLLLRERPLHGYELLERLPELGLEGRVDIGFGHRRFPSREEWLSKLEEYQRDLEQEIADVADVIKHLQGDQPTQTATV